MAKDEFDGMGATSKRDTWRPPKHLKKHKCEDKVGASFHNQLSPAHHAPSRCPRRSPGRSSSRSSECLQSVCWTTYAPRSLQWSRTICANRCSSGNERPLCAEDCHRSRLGCGCACSGPALKKYLLSSILLSCFAFLTHIVDS